MFRESCSTPTKASAEGLTNEEAMLRKGCLREVEDCHALQIWRKGVPGKGEVLILVQILIQQFTALAYMRRHTKSHR